MESLQSQNRARIGTMNRYDELLLHMQQKFVLGQSGFMGRDEAAYSSAGISRASYFKGGRRQSKIEEMKIARGRNHFGAGFSTGKSVRMPSRFTFGSDVSVEVVLRFEFLAMREDFAVRRKNSKLFRKASMTITGRLS